MVLPGDRWPLAVAALLMSTLGWAVASVVYATQRLAYYRRIDSGMAAEDVRSEGRRS